MDTWRIVKTTYSSEAFSGEGAYLYGGRWNSEGTRMIYLSGSLSLAVLEILVHLPVNIALKFSTYRVSFKESQVESLSVAQLPEDWRVEPPASSTQAIGDQWVREARSLVLEVPSVIIPEERNYLLNPQHPDFEKIKRGPETPFVLDSRLLK